ncbi:N-acetylmuramoyl-L-alanine amidase [Methylobacterium radiodurans]|uniref:N-acetylmuramoyl-L-alanine amidase n=2 Tax=Methylobacterium radiodurans TaxID=2202828 RepID=A0A2U8VPZ5_9HYPH|nr:N-acetylmuramoyl-L-alanine amidase [Methylobacterium radiodurans]
MSPGATSARGKTEFSFNQSLSQVLVLHLRSKGFVNLFVNRLDGRENLAFRVASLNSYKPDFVISIHHDSVVGAYQKPWNYNGRPFKYSDIYNGWSLLVSTSNASSMQSIVLAEKIADRLLSHGLPFSKHHAEPISGENRQFIRADFGIYRYDNLAVLKMTNSPAVLVEAGIIVNRDEEEALSGSERRNILAKSIAEAAYEYCLRG